MKVIDYHGTTDGIRWGTVGFGNHRRRFHWDRLAGTVALFDMDGLHRSNRGLLTQDRDPERIAAVLALLAGRP